MKTFVLVGNADRVAEYIKRHGILLEYIQDYKGLSTKPDFLISFNNTQMIPASDLKIPELCLNMHPAPLPEYAGMYCHYWAHKEGVREYGATVHTMVAKPDAGRIVAQKRYPVVDDTPRTLFIRAMAAGFNLMCGVINDLVWGKPLEFVEQDFSKRRLYTVRMAKEAGFV